MVVVVVVVVVAWWKSRSGGLRVGWKSRGGSYFLMVVVVVVVAATVWRSGYALSKKYYLLKRQFSGTFLWPKMLLKSIPFDVRPLEVRPILTHS